LSWTHGLVSVRRNPVQWLAAALVPHRRPLPDLIVAAELARRRDVARRARYPARPGKVDAELDRRMDLRRERCGPRWRERAREQHEPETRHADPRHHGDLP